MSQIPGILDQYRLPASGVAKYSKKSQVRSDIHTPNTIIQYGHIAPLLLLCLVKGISCDCVAVSVVVKGIVDVQIWIAGVLQQKNWYVFRTRIRYLSMTCNFNTSFGGRDWIFCRFRRRSNWIVGGLFCLFSY
jgi:hypothetical protein